MVQKKSNNVKIWEDILQINQCRRIERGSRKPEVLDLYDTFLCPWQYGHFGHTWSWEIELALNTLSDGPCWESCPSATAAA
jgi:hypothetical protein